MPERTNTINKIPAKRLLQQEQGFTKFLDKNFFRDNVHIYRFYFVISVRANIASIIFISFITDNVRLKALVTGWTILITLQVEGLVPAD